MSCRSTAGGHVSTALARVATGLKDAEIQHIYHALKREGGHLPAPTKQELKAWESRQQDLLDRTTKMSDTRRDGLRDKLFRARSEDLDGATFYAMSRVEARARQEVAIRSVEGAIDLAPAGSQRHLYELDEHGLPAKVWYASYGSNLHRDRFLVYVKGGSPEGSSRWYRGCRDAEIPDEDIAIRIPGARPHFALTSRVWNGGIAFIDTAKGETATGLGRAYKVTREQFEDVVAQENGLKAGQCAPVPYADVFDTGRVVTGSGPYETLLHIGDHDGAPVLSFTSPFSTRDALGRRGEVTRTPVGETEQEKTPVKMPVLTNRPSPAYLRMIGSGLAETFGMNEVAQADYLRGCPGGDRWTRREVVQILRTPNPPPVTTTYGSYGSGGSYSTGSGWSGGGTSRGSSGRSSSSRNLKSGTSAEPVALKDPLPTVSNTPTPAPNKRGYYSGVATYASASQRADSLKGWKEELKVEQQRLLREEQYVLRVTYSTAPIHNDPVLRQREVDQLRERYAETLARVEELTVKVDYAKAQSPVNWYPPRPRNNHFWAGERSDITVSLEANEKRAQYALQDIATTNAANRRAVSNARTRLTRANKEIERLKARLVEAGQRETADAAALAANPTAGSDWQDWKTRPV